jgi:phage tail protein X
MSRAIITRDGDVLDAIAYRVYGDEQAVHALLEANPHIAAREAAVLPSGLKLTLPDIVAPSARTRTVRLWSNGA